MTKHRLRPEDVARDYEADAKAVGLSKNLKQLNKLSQRLACDISILEARIRAVRAVRHIHDGKPFSIRKEVFNRIVLFHVHLLPEDIRSAHIIREGPKSWIVEGRYDHQLHDTFASRHETKRRALEVACEYIAHNRKPTKQ